MKRFIPHILAVVSVALVIALYYDTNTLIHNQYDDSAISMRYAINLSEHGQLVMNLGDRTDAASSFLYTVVLAMFYKIGFHNLELVGFAINMLALGCIAAFVYLSVFKLSRNMWASIALALVASLYGFISGWSIHGFDTVPFAALLCALVCAVLYGRNTLALVLVCAVVLMRPEGLLIVPFWWYTTGRDKIDGGIVLSLIALFYLSKWAYYSTPISHAMQFKQLCVYYHSQPMAVIHTWATFAIAAPVFAFIGMFYDRRVWWIGAYIAVSAASCLVGVHSDYERYTAHLWPLMLIAGSPALRRI